MAGGGGDAPAQNGGGAGGGSAARVGPLLYHQLTAGNGRGSRSEDGSLDGDDNLGRNGGSRRRSGGAGRDGNGTGNGSGSGEVVMPQQGDWQSVPMHFLGQDDLEAVRFAM
jgi:hypothetical protein